MRSTTRALGALALTLALVAPACGDDGEETETGTDLGPSPTAAPGTTAPAGTMAPGTTRPATGAPAGVTAEVGGDEVDIELVCSGVDGAVVVVSTRGSLVQLVREEGLALRISTEGDTFAETDDVETTDLDGATRYEGTVTVVGEQTPVLLELPDELGDLPDC